MAFFVMMYSQRRDSAMPIVTEDESGEQQVKFWDTELDAVNAMEEHPFASRLGYDVFEMHGVKNTE